MSRIPTLENVPDEENTNTGGYINYSDLPEDHNFEVRGTSQKMADMLKDIERKQQSRYLAVPTNDGEVRKKLRDLGEPITYFGEDKADRRERLKRYVMEKFGDEPTLQTGSEDVEMGDGEDDEEEETYSYGPIELLQARKIITTFSLEKAKKRIITQKQDATISILKQVKHRRQINEKLSQYNLLGSQLVSRRAVSAVRFSPSSKLLAEGSWTGNIKILDVPNLETQLEFTKGHDEKIGGVAWHPQSGKTQTSSALNLISGGGEGNIAFWSLEQNEPLALIPCQTDIVQGHTQRICRVGFHPSGRYIGTASYDTTWRLWDVETQQQLLFQEGHDREVYTIGFQDDGALVGSAGLDGIGRIWDIRSGKAIMVLDGHCKEIYALDFSPNGYQVATGSGDCTIKIWDIRAVKTEATIPAHKKMVSDLKFFRADNELEGMKTNGTYLASSSYDRSVKIFSADNWLNVANLKGHSDRVISVDISSDGQFIASSGWDKSVKLWADENIVL